MRSSEQSVSPAARGSASPPGSLQPTRVRWRIVGLLALITALTYLDRLNLSIAGKYIQDEFAFSTQTMGYLLSAFVWGYALCQVPGGWLGDRYGPRAVLTLAILWWSVFTAATGIAPRLPIAAWFGIFWSFAVVRFLIGVGEASALPNANKVIALWIGSTQRGVANSLFVAGVGAGGALTPAFIAAIMQRWGWRSSFYLCGGLGIAAAFAWRLYATNRPEEHPGVNPAELELIRSGEARTPFPPASVPRARPPWRRMLTRRSVLGLMLSYFCIGFVAYIFYTWFFIYLVRVRSLTVKQGGFWGSTPFIAVALLAPLGGWFSDRAVRGLGKRRGRQTAVWLGVALSAALLALGGHTSRNTPAILLLAGAAGFNLFATASWWATVNDLTRNFCGALAGLMNMCGNVGGALAPIVTAYIASRFGWTRAFDFAALVTVAAGLFWFLVDADDDLEAASIARTP